MRQLHGETEGLGRYRRGGWSVEFRNLERVGVEERITWRASYSGDGQQLVVVIVIAGQDMTLVGWSGEATSGNATLDQLAIEATRAWLRGRRVARSWM